jgi:hypothetical protein
VTEANGINGGDPMWVSAAGGNYLLQSGSPLLNAGVNLSAYFTDDYFQLPRSGWSIGPFQVQASAAAEAASAGPSHVLRGPITISQGVTIR